MKLDRAINKLIAYTTNRFWIPCPICKEYFGGHEEMGFEGLYIGNFMYKCVCKDCEEKAYIKNRQNPVYLKDYKGGVVYIG